ncbi:ThuA domain-containing protein [Streptomyces sp. NBC_01497]|uniref:ThuA domain-containing protein n=1 Tax=Streptomyces sp. NBC_01497 TaxID=2903885 RepID=UPI002E36924C|nr:ThuA domain-containing protein [Streptomyces sp. NBC_01497]
MKLSRKKKAYAVLLGAPALCAAAVLALGTSWGSTGGQRSTTQIRSVDADIGNVTHATDAPESSGSKFNVLAFYDSKQSDPAHASFDEEAKGWFPQVAGSHNFSWTATDDWSKLNAGNLSHYQVVMFLDDYPHVKDQQQAFENYMKNGGAWMGFHVSAYNDNPSDWPWYHNTFLGTGAFKSNSWEPTSETLKIEDRSNPATRGLPDTIKSSTSEWYSWDQDLRKNPDLRIIASIDQSSFPVGTDPAQTWRKGDFPVVWTNKHYKMIYNNFGHNAMDYAKNKTLSHTFASEQQDQLVLQGLEGLGGVDSKVTPAKNPSTSPSPPMSPSPSVSSSSAPASPSPQPSSSVTAPVKAGQVMMGTTGKCVEVSGNNENAESAVQLNDCTKGDSQLWSSNGNGTLQALGQCMDLQSGGLKDGTPVIMAPCNASSSQQWARVGHMFVNAASGRCLDAKDKKTANETKLQVWFCWYGANQRWHLTSNASPSNK